MRRTRFFIPLLPIPGCCLMPAAEDDSSGQYYQALRTNDLATLRALIQTVPVNNAGRQGVTPLMNAVAFGGAEAVKLLLDAGAAVNARDAFDATALFFCAGDIAKARLLLAAGADVNAAATNGASEIVRLLLQKGAGIYVRDFRGVTPLMAAADANDTASVRLLLARGADIRGTNMFGFTPLISAASHGNVEVVKLLLARGADVKYASPKDIIPKVKQGSIAVGLLTALHTAAPFGPPEIVRTLLAAGAPVDARDVRGMTPLMLAVACDRADAGTVRPLLEHGADAHARDANGESVLDWARKFNSAPVMDALGLESAAPAAAVIPAATARPGAVTSQDISQSVSLLQRSATSFFREGGCASCHSHSLTAIAVSAARANRVPVDEAAAAEHQNANRVPARAMQQMLLQRMEGPGGADGLNYPLLHTAADGVLPDRGTDAMVLDLAGRQFPAGNWHRSALARPPLFDGDFGSTAMAIRSLRVYGIPARRAGFEARIGRAAAWLRQARPAVTTGAAMQAVGLHWAGSDAAPFLRNLIHLQRPDGGWAPNPWLAGDAYTTGLALWALHEAGTPSSDPVYRRGVAYLLAIRQPDGSWHVRSRAPKFQPYFQSGFPYDHDQWISASATAWATAALAWTIDSRPGPPATVTAAAR